MAENTVKKIATRESYGNSLKELAEEFPKKPMRIWSYWMQTWQLQPRRVSLRKHIRNVFLTAVLQKPI